MVVLVTGVSSLPSPGAADDFQLWTELQVRHDFKPSKFTLLWSTDNRFKNNGTDHFTFNTTIGFYYKFLKWLKFGPFYRFEKKEGDDAENRIMPELVLRGKFGPITIAGRNRFEFRIFPDDFRYRNRTRVKISHKFKKKPVSFTLFMFDEIFIETDGRGFNENRLAAGNGFGFLKDHVVFSLFYQMQRKKSSSGVWSTNHILGTYLTLNY